MFPIPRRFAHYVFAVLQSGITTLVASGIASLPLRGSGRMIQSWAASWLVAWLLMLPVVILAAPLLRSLAARLTRE